MFKFIKNLFTKEKEYDARSVFYRNLKKLHILDDLINVANIKGLTMDDVSFKAKFERKNDYYIYINICIGIGDYKIYNNFTVGSEGFGCKGLKIKLGIESISMDCETIRVVNHLYENTGLVDNIIEIIISPENIFEIKKSLYELIKDDIDKFNSEIERQKSIGSYRTYLHDQINISIFDKNFNK